MRKTLRFLGLVLAISLFGATLNGAATAQDYDPKAVPPLLPDLAGRAIITVSSEDFVPFSFVDAQSNIAVGFEFDLLAEICRRLNCTLTRKTASWDGMAIAVSRNEYDLGHVGITFRDVETDQIAFSEPYTATEQRLLVRADEDRFSTAAELVADPNLKFGGQPGATSYFSAEALVGEAAVADRVVPYDDFAVAVEALVRGDIDAIVADVISGVGFIGAKADQLKLLDEPLAVNPLTLIFPKESDLVAPFNLAIESMRHDGYLAYLENKWFRVFKPGN
jgi:polar amino acid transport system substrate-binding protein